MTTIKQVNLTIANAYLVIGKQPILVDTGGPNSLAKLTQALKSHGVVAQDLGLIVHTHGHGDHVGSTAALQQMARMPTLLYQSDLQMAERGVNSPVHYSRLAARMIAPFVMRHFAGFVPSMTIQSEFSLKPYGIEAEIIHTPGHTPGSVSIVFENGSAIVGDVMMGGHLGGAFQPHLPRYHYFYDDMAQIHSSLKTLLDRGVETFYVGHGGAIERAAVLRWLKGQAR